jgi:hypothetical protein
MHPGESYLSLPRDAPSPAPCGGVGCCSPCDLEVSYGCSVFILQKGVPLSRGTDNIDTFILLEGADARVITKQREQYDATVHLFIGTGRSPGKSTFVSLTFTYDHNINH